MNLTGTMGSKAIFFVFMSSVCLAKIVSANSLGTEKREVATTPSHGVLMCITPTPDADQVIWKNGSTEHNIYLNAENVS